MYCIHCGNKTNDQSKFCGSCGKEIIRKKIEVPLEVQKAPTYNRPIMASSPPLKSKKSHIGLIIAVVSIFFALFLALAIFFGIKLIGNSYNSPGDDDEIVKEEEEKNEKIAKDLGKAEYKEIEDEYLMGSETWGYLANNQIIVVLEDSALREQAEEIALEIEGEIVGEIELINLYQIQVSEMTEEMIVSLVEELMAMNGVEDAFPNVLAKSLDVTGTSCTPLKDPVFSEADHGKHYEIIGMNDAWGIIKASGVKLNHVYVGVLDTAIYTGSDEFNGKVKITGDTTDNPDLDKEGEVVFGEYNHGTLVTHVIGADPENSGMVGVASVLEDKLNIEVINAWKTLPDDIKLYTGSDSDDMNLVSFEKNNSTHVIESLVHLIKLVKSGQTVINCSFGPEYPRESLKLISKAYKKFFEKMYEEYPEVVFVAAAGNEGDHPYSDGKLSGTNYFPGGIVAPNVITVGAINNDGSKASFSNYAGEGGEVTLSAPGVEMVLGVNLSKDAGDDTGKPVKASGTSFAAPQVTATVALLQSINSKLTAQEIKDILVGTAAKGVTTGNQSIPIPEGLGAGVLRVDEAVLKVINDLREKEGLEPFERDYLVACSQVKLVAEKSDVDKEYTILATVEEASGKATDVKIEVSGDHSLVGKKRQSVKSGDSAEWTLVVDEQSVFVKVTRLDTASCAYLTLNFEDTEPVDEVQSEDTGLAGTWITYSISTQDGSVFYSGDEGFDTFYYQITFTETGGISGVCQTSDGVIDASFSGSYEAEGRYIYCTLPRSNMVDSGDYPFSHLLPAEYSANADNIWLTFEYIETYEGEIFLEDWALNVKLIKN